MALERHRIASVLIVVMAAWVADAWASDEDSEPLYVIHDGRRIPTMIIPPQTALDGATRSASLQVVESDPESELDADEGDQPGDSGERGDAADEGRETRRGARRYTIGHYGGYPVSVLYPASTDWGYYPYSPPYYPPNYGQTLRDIYEAQRYAAQREWQRRFNIRDMRQRKERVLVSHEKALRVGLEHLKRGDYAQAVIALTMAAELNQGDPACRIHLAQARVAQGHYDEAAKVLRRALQLQPKLTYVALNLRSYYGDPAEFDAHVDKLAAWVKEHRAGADTYFVLGYLEFQRENLEKAYGAFRAAAAARPKDSLIASYLKITRPPAK